MSAYFMDIGSIRNVKLQLVQVFICKNLAILNFAVMFIQVSAALLIRSVG